MPRIRILTETDLRRVMALSPELIEAIDHAFRQLASGRVVMPKVLSMAIAEHNGEVDVKTAYVPGLDGFAIKVSPGFFDNPKIGLPSTSGLMMVLSSRTGQVQALLLDNGYLTDLRTAAAGAVAARALARPDATSACIIGAGLQARLQLQALTLVRPLRTALVWARDMDKAHAMAAEMAQVLGIDLRAEADPEAAVAQAEIIVTTTPATAPVLQAAWLRPGQHVTAMGSDQHGKNEIDPAALAIARYVPDRLSQTREMGELRAAIAAGVIAADREYADLGAVLAGAAPGRLDASDITLADLTGTGVQDTAIATLALARAGTAGTMIET
ncbi:ectoine utilization protein EutC [Rhodobacteraceae bacterium 2376]|uniref:Ectoine utilization protein EutC n=1 Tax=Rhabdonatronobacter sediminivivens TaxID=2743469 RepID=A0A7Z0HZB5_9RHOB|nr:ectoine utilization protein EutC [Rhabdonatronobacter sediminivivens]NYS25059.1 ectoine utilization protein EutC [Rhabdonatronobacter sediminivivens]